MDSRRLPALFIALFLALPLAEAILVKADTPDSDIAICIYPISGTYGAFARYWYYVSLLSTAILRRNDWLAAGIMATAMLYSSSAAVHAWVILYNSGLNPEVLDADIISIKTIVLSTTCLSWSITTSRTLYTSKARNIIFI